LVKEGIKAERLELKTKLNAVAKSRTKNLINGLTDDYEEEKKGKRNKIK
jgi:hypothetical protein